MLTLAILPAIYRRDRVHPATCALTALVLAVFSITFLINGFYGAGTVDGAASVLWFVMLYNSLRRKRDDQL